VLPAALLVFYSCGPRAEEARLTPETLVQHQTGIRLLQEDSNTSLINARPPIDEFDTPYLFPHEHTDLPGEIADWLNERGYVIPQYIPEESWAEYFPINVITGEFIKPGQTDWAVYCTNRKATGLIIFQGGSADNPEIVEYYPALIDYHMSYRVKFGCCYEYITTASPEEMYEAYLGMKQYGVPEPPPLDHDGICGSVFMEPCTMFYYRYEGEWVAIRASASIHGDNQK